MLGAEVDRKSAARLDRRIRVSGLVERKTLEAFDWDFQPTLDKSLVLELARLDFVGRYDDLVITGKSGTGKSHILKAVGLRACVQGVSLRYARCVDLLADLHAGLADDTYPRRLKAWVRPDLLIIDDVGLGQVRQRDETTSHRGPYPSPTLASSPPCKPIFARALAAPATSVSTKGAARSAARR